jgi:hypothetical protein
MKRFHTYLFSSILCFGCIPVMAAPLLEVSDVKLQQRDVDNFLAYKNMEDQSLSQEQRKNLLETLFLREKLSNSTFAKDIEASDAFKTIVNEFRKDLLAQQVLEKQSHHKVPDFTDRAKELYQANLESKYTLPERFHVKTLSFKKNEQASLLQAHEQLQKDPSAIESISKTYAAKLEERWVSSQNSAIKVWKSAKQLADDKQWVSNPLNFREESKLLVLLDSKPAELMPFEKVKDELLEKLKQEHIDNRRKDIINALKYEYKANAKIDEAYLKD